MREHLRRYCSETGRPSIDPKLMIRMLIIGYCMCIRFERRVCDEVHLNLAYRWFCRLGLESDVPDHYTFSKNRHGRFRKIGKGPCTRRLPSANQTGPRPTLSTEYVSKPQPTKVGAKISS